MFETIYIDKQFHCHRTNDGTMTAVETSFFIGKCDEFVEGHVFVPSGQTYIRPSDGKQFDGQTIFAWKPYSDIDSAQREYERALIVDMQSALNKLGVTLDE